MTYAAVGVGLMVLGALLAVPVARRLLRRKAKDYEPGGTVQLTEREAKLFAETEAIARRSLCQRPRKSKASTSSMPTI